MNAFRLTRLLRSLVLLQSGRGYNARQLADECEVNRRTVFRDLKLLKEAGVPIHFDPASMTYLARSPSSAPTPTISPDELRALVLFQQFSLLGATDRPGSAARSALLKLLASAPPKLREDAAALLRSCVSVAAQPPLPETREEQFWAILDGIRCRQQVRITYNDADGQTRTKLAPYLVISAPDGWSVVGRSSLHRQVRCFAIEQIVRVDMTEDAYSRPPRFCAERWLPRASPRPVRTQADADHSRGRSLDKAISSNSSLG
ncbi:MAG: WYL domain-containing protein [Planctomycetes bacterium]|nr:WYL domain-containing protein [Planctomycetota bacterium]